MSTTNWDNLSTSPKDILGILSKTDFYPLWEPIHVPTCISSIGDIGKN